MSVYVSKIDEEMSVTYESQLPVVLNSHFFLNSFFSCARKFKGNRKLLDILFIFQDKRDSSVRHRWALCDSDCLNWEFLLLPSRKVKSF